MNEGASVVRDLRADIAAEAGALATYEALIRMSPDEGSREALRHLATREVAHARMFMKALEAMNKLDDPIFGDLKPDDTVDVYFNLTAGPEAERRGPWNSEPDFHIRDLVPQAAAGRRYGRRTAGSARAAEEVAAPAISIEVRATLTGAPRPRSPMTGRATQLGFSSSPRRPDMHFGAAMFFTDYSMAPGELGRALEERGFESLWAPEHSHIPVSRASPFPNGGDLPKQYYDVMDPFVTLTAAAAATQTLKVGTGVCLVQQRDPIQTAKLVASIDQVSAGRFLFGVGSGWNAEEMADHGTPFKSRHKIARERIEAMKVIWTETKAEYHGEFVNFDPMMAWPKPVQKPYPPVIVGGAFPYGARRAIRYGDGWVPHASRPEYGDVSDFLPQFHQMAKEAGRDPASLPVTMFRVVEELDRLRHYRDIGIARVVITLPSAGADQVMPILDRWAEKLRQV